MAAIGRGAGGASALAGANTETVSIQRSDHQTALSTLARQDWSQSLSTVWLAANGST